MNHKLFTRIYSQNKKKINISLDVEVKAKLEAQRAIDGISISEKIESLYRSHKSTVEALVISESAFIRSRGERGKPMYGNAIRQPCGVFLTPKAIDFFDKQAEKKKIDRSKIIELALRKLLFD